MRLPRGANILKCRYVFRHGHDLRSGQLFHERITFLVIAVSMAAKHDLDVGKLETQLRYGVLNDRNRSFIGRINKDVTLRRRDEKSGERLCTDVENISDDLMRWELLDLLLVRADV